ncbi:hypothetical protein CONLIGDRAFT_682253 [Coniochaeta ligniaria NRRL 30616]|uniref:Uncharacterized protein n=1 Tax=Coniochaeta ligniaria NRRL 30616 TaxID=1408157 RepID=A0A1J7J1H6_9PEZI|nr:hypothetical protein CONLIGDRAFT_682253 [Coniochaeta ligniaria NRRL 30616]
MASTTTSIPRFLLPQTGLLWQRFRVPNAASSGSIIIRYASTTPAKGSKPIVLEKPARFNPPSHGSRLPKKTTPRHYGGELSFEETQAQKKKDYPGLPPPPDTWAHWFWNSRAFHLTITMGTLTGLALFTFVQNFKQSSPFADMVPSLSDFVYHPISSGRIVVEIIRLSEAHNTAIVQEKRKRRVDDVEKRQEYRKAHGLDGNTSFFGTWGAKKDEEDKSEEGPRVAEEAAAVATEVHETPNPVVPAGEHADAMGGVGPRKKFLGIF